MTYPFTARARDAMRRPPEPPMPGPPKAPPPAPPDVVCAVALGQPIEPTALAILEIVSTLEGEKKVPHYDVKALKRWEPHTDYASIIADSKSALAKLNLTKAPLCIEHTAAGLPVYEQFRKARCTNWSVPIVLSGGAKLTQEGAGWSVPKRDLVGAIASCLGADRLHVARQLPLGDILEDELKSFKMKVSLTPDGIALEALRVRPNEDLVIAVGVAVWYAVKGRRRFRFTC